MARYSRSLCWFRRDLRAHDHAALYRALATSEQVLCVFVFDTDILDALPSRRDRRVEFIWLSLAELKRELEASGGGLIVCHGRAVEEIPELAKSLRVAAVFANHDYEPAAIERDRTVAVELSSNRIDFHTFKDQVVLEKDEVLTQTGRPFAVFTPYKNTWLKRIEPSLFESYPVERYRGRLAKPTYGEPFPSLEQLGFEKTDLLELGVVPGSRGAEVALRDFRLRMARYRETRDYPALDGVSHLSVHNRFGTISIRALVRATWNAPGGEAWLNELIWRDFYFMILHHFPYVIDRPFKRKYERLPFPNDAALFAAWREARTGYPLIDAAMRQINQTGYMHNRLRMVVASFLVKDLLIDWRLGERYFADHLIDYDRAANNGGWQWAASVGCDAQPYFRIFNPITQSQKFDAEGKFIRRYVPELARCDDQMIHAPWLMSREQQRAAGVIVGQDYPMPIVEHAEQRKKALALFR